MVIREDNNNQQTAKLNQNYRFVEHLRSASFLDRIAAFIIDYFIILSPVATLVLSPFKKQLGLSALMGEDINSYLVYFNVFIILFVLSLFYNFLLTYFFRSTLGQMFMGLKVETIIEEQKLSFFDSVLRSLVFTVSLFCLGLPFLLILTHQGKRSLHGLVSDSYVFSTKSYSKTKLSPVLASRTSLLLGTVLLFFVFLSAVQTVLGFNTMEELSSSFSLCEDVSETIANWPDQSDVIPERLSVAMALYAIEGADKECLEKEVDYVFDSGEEAGLAYLASAFIHAENAEVSDKYLSKVCELNSKSETCLMAKVIDNWATDNIDLVRYTLKRIKGDSVYINLWKSRFLISEGEFKQAFNVINKLPKIKAISRYSSLNKAKLYWFNGKYEQAKLVTDMIFEKEIVSDSDEIADWLCFEELEKNCSELTSTSCGYIDDQLKKGKLAGIAKFKSLECQGQLTGYHSYDWEPEVDQLINFKLNKDGEASDNLDLFLATSYTDQRIPYVAILNFLTKSPVIDELVYEKLKEYTKGINLRFEKTKLSQKILSYLVKNKYYDFAYNYGEQLLDNNSSEEFRKNLIVSAYYAGDKEQAKIYLGQFFLEKKVVSRVLASSSQFDFIKKVIEGEK